jgi:CRP-like cAMP-binding protein
MVNWIDEFRITERSLGYRYATTLHWSLTQFTPGSMNIQPMNVIERTYCVCVLVIGMVIFAAFISNITASMTQLRTMQGEISRQFWLLRRFLRQHGVPLELSFRILRYTEFQANSGKNLVPESRVTILGLLSEQMRNELYYQINYCGVHSHPLFERVGQISDTMLHLMSKESMSRKSCAKNDPIFKEGVTAMHMYFVARGNIRYDRGDVQHHDIAGKSDWISEQALWTDWVHMGEARTVAECQVIAINSKAFVAAGCQDFTVHSLLTTYAHSFVEWLNQLPDADVTEVFSHESTQASEHLPSTYISDSSEKSAKSPTVIGSMISRITKRRPSLAR